MHTPTTTTDLEEEGEVQWDHQNQEEEGEEVEEHQEAHQVEGEVGEEELVVLREEGEVGEEEEHHRGVGEGREVEGCPVEEEETLPQELQPLTSILPLNIAGT